MSNRENAIAVGVLDPRLDYSLPAAAVALGIDSADPVEWLKRHLIYTNRVRYRREGNYVWITGEELHRWISNHDESEAAP